MTLDDPAERPEELHLDPGIVDDEELLAAVVDEFIGRDPQASGELHEIAVLHGVLHEVVGDQFWPVFERAEELTTARWADLTVRLTRWAFNEGRRFPAGSEEPEP